jgi:tRNA 2-(methylsulfanyl)-N6-isopentenyladenosine37 hydroxylase
MEQKFTKVMLGLKLPTDPRWIDFVEMDLEEILTDHAYCEQKAATNAISNIVRFPDYPEMVEAMLKICQEEIAHFVRVYEELKKRGFKLGRERRDPYVLNLMDFIIKGGKRSEQFVDRMLFAALIEARSCERFKILSEQLSDIDLRTFYRELMESEAGHYTVFIGLARKYANGINVQKRWQEFLEYEATLVKKYGKRQTIHG